MRREESPEHVSVGSQWHEPWLGNTTEYWAAIINNTSRFYAPIPPGKNLHGVFLSLKKFYVWQNPIHAKKNYPQNKVCGKIHIYAFIEKGNGRSHIRLPVEMGDGQEVIVKEGLALF